MAARHFVGYLFYPPAMVAPHEVNDSHRRQGVTSSYTTPPYDARVPKLAKFEIPNFSPPKLRHHITLYFHRRLNLMKNTLVQPTIVAS